MITLTLHTCQTYEEADKFAGQFDGVDVAYAQIVDYPNREPSAIMVCIVSQEADEDVREVALDLIRTALGLEDKLPSYLQ